MSIKKNTQSVWGASPAGTIYSQGNRKGTKEFFDAVLVKRFDYEVPFIPEILDGYDLKNKRVLEIGCGAGFDQFELCKRGAYSIGIDITPDNPSITKTHLSYYGYFPETLIGDAERLPFKDNSFDFIYSFGVLHHTPDIEKSLLDANRILIPNGTGIIAVYNRNSIFYRINLGFIDYILKFGFLKYSMKERLAMVEYTTSDERPLVNVYSKKELIHILKKSGFEIDDLLVRKFTIDDIPSAPIIKKLYRYVPESFLNMLGKRWGWYLIAKVRK